MISLAKKFQLTHHNAVYAVAFSPDGKSLASASLDNNIKVWSADQGELKQVLRGHGDGVAFVDFLDDGRLVSASLDKSIRVWNSEGKIVQTFPGHSEYLTCAAVAAKPMRVISGGFDKLVRLWEVGKEGQQAQLAGHEGTVQAVAISASGRWLASGGDDNVIRLWDWESKSLVRKLAGHSATVEALHFSSDEKTLYSAGADGKLKLWGIGGELLAERETGTAHIKTLGLNASGTIVASGGNDGLVKLWKADVSLSALTEIHPHKNTVYGIAFSPDSTQLATSGFDRTIVVWSLTSPA